MKYKCFVFLTSIGATGVLSQAASSLADTAPILSCLSSENALSFEIRNTAAPTFFQGLLSGNLEADLSCQRVKAAGTIGADIPVTIWECTEIRGDAPTVEGAVSITVTTGGITGRTLARVQQAQMFPLPPAHLKTLVCK
ncbi:MAG: hypothetical protein M3Q07_19485 [Pseudobdellovibrionaceae bacterium]|nr:hypothetical protein [Pseudobdellovibrionaceae bacterium]